MRTISALFGFVITLLAGCELVNPPDYCKAGNSLDLGSSSEMSAPPSRSQSLSPGASQQEAERLFQAFLSGMPSNPDAETAPSMTPEGTEAALAYIEIVPALAQSIVSSLKQANPAQQNSGPGPNALLPTTRSSLKAATTFFETLLEHGRTLHEIRPEPASSDPEQSLYTVYGQNGGKKSCEDCMNTCDNGDVAGCILCLSDFVKQATAQQSKICDCWPGASPAPAWSVGLCVSNMARQFCSPSPR